MKIEKIKDEALEKHFKIVIPAKEITSAMELELKKIASTVKMAGFRAGKVPLSIVSKKYAPAVRADAIENKVKEVLTKVMKDNKMNPSMTPNIDDMEAEEGKDVSFVAKFEILPEITHPDLKKIKLEKPVAKIDSKDIDLYLEDLIKNNPSYTKPSKTKAEKGEQVVIDFEGFIDGKAFDGGTATNQKLVLGSGQFIPGFEDQLIGAKAGDEVKVKVTFPATYHAKDLAGKEAVFETKVHNVFKPEQPKIDDELGKKFGFEDLEALKKDVENTLRTSVQEDIFELLKLRLFDELETLLKFDVPPTMLEREVESIKKQMSDVIKSEKASDNEDDKAKKPKKEDAKEEETYRKIALRRVKIGMFIADYAEKSNIKVENRDLNTAISRQARMFPGSERMIVDYYTKNRNALESLKGSILEEKTVHHILDKEISVKDKEFALDKLKAYLEKEMDRDIA